MALVNTLYRGRMESVFLENSSKQPQLLKLLFEVKAQLRIVSLHFFQDDQNELEDFDLKLWIFVEKISNGEELLDHGWNLLLVLEQVVSAAFQENLGNGEHEVRVRILGGFLLGAELYSH